MEFVNMLGLFIFVGGVAMLVAEMVMRPRQ